MTDCKPKHAAAKFARKQARWLGFATALVLCVALSLGVGCSSGSGSASGGIGGTGISRGTVNGFGSLIVNGITWNVSNASFRLDGATGSESDIRVGMIVTIRGNQTTLTAGSASSVEFNDSIEGRIASVTDRGDGTAEVSVFDRVVLVEDGRTIFADSSAAPNFDFDTLTMGTMNVNDIVEVSGFDDGNGRIVATRMERRGQAVLGTSRVEVRGIVSGFVLATNTFNIGGVAITAPVGTDQVSGGIRNGIQVEVRGILTGNTAIQATIVTDDDDSLDDDNAFVELEGIVSNLNGRLFNLSGQMVDASGLASLPAFGNGSLIEVEGPIVGGVLLAAVIEIDEEDHRIDAAIEDANNDVNLATGEFILLDIIVETNASTQFDDDFLDNPNFGLASLLTGDFLEVRGRKIDVDRILATHVKRDDPDDVKLRGTVQAFTIGATSSSVTILNVPAGFNGGTTFEDGEGNTITRAQFEALLELGVTLEVEDQSPDRANLAPIVSEIEIEGTSIGIDAAVLSLNEIDDIAQTVTLLGVEIQTDLSTEYNDSRDGDPSFGFGGIMPGDFLKVRGTRSGTTSIKANSIERESDDDIEIRGTVQAFTPDVGSSQIEIFGIPIVFADSTNFSDNQGGTLSRMAFEMNLQVGDFVEVTDDDSDPAQLAAIVSDVQFLDAASAALTSVTPIQVISSLSAGEAGAGAGQAAAARTEWDGLEALGPDWSDPRDEGAAAPARQREREWDAPAATTDTDSASDAGAAADSDLLRNVVEAMARLVGDTDR